MENRIEHIETTYLDHGGKLRNYIRRYLPYEQAEDVVQDVFMQLFSGINQIKSLESITSWLYKTAKNRAIDIKRKKKPELLADKKIYSEEDNLFLEDILPSFLDDPEEELFRKAIWEEILEALDELPDEQSEIFELHEFENRSFKEISEITGENVNTLISRKRYAVLYLREKLNELYEQLKN